MANATAQTLWSTKRWQ